MSRRTLLFIHALTGLHPGSGTALGTVDLPVQRERHTGWPVIPGSSLKGVLRDECRRAVAATSHGGDLAKANSDDPHLTAVFGPARVEESDTAHAGALSVSDARILAFPVRSLVGIFAWATCPAVLVRLRRDLSYVSEGSGAVPASESWTDGIPVVGQGRVACAADSPLLIGKQMVLEEFEFVRDDQADATSIAEWVAGQLRDELTGARLRKALVVLHDDDFQHFVAHATEVVARVGLDYERKTVRPGALFYEEFLPPETLFYSVLAADDSRRGGNLISDADVLDFLENHVPPFVQIGADETIGRGICAVNLAK